MLRIPLNGLSRIDEKFKKRFRLIKRQILIEPNYNINNLNTNKNKQLTICYFTCRKNPYIQWFFRSLNRELKGDWKNINIIIVDYLYQYNPDERLNEFKQYYEKYNANVKHIAPKPCAVQGKYRVTNKNYFAASNSRNTAFIHCETPYIACIDDLSVIKEGWLEVVLWGMKNNYVLYGSYSKVNNLQCDIDGNYTFDTDITNKGLDSRYKDQYINNNFANRVAGSWLFGCSFAMPLELALKIDGFDETCDTISSEDSDFGIRLGRVTNNIYYSKQMFTYEDDLLHFVKDNFSFIRNAKLLTENSLMKHKIGLMSDHAIIQNVMESNSYLPFIANNLEKMRELKNDENYINNLIKEFKYKLYWVNGIKLSEM